MTRAVERARASGECEARVLERSRALCARITRKAARNFYFGLKLLPEPKRSAMFALYAYMRLVDDIADAPGRSDAQRSDDLEAWRIKTHDILRGAAGASPNAGILAASAGAIESHEDDIWPAFREMIGNYAIPAKLFDDMIAGQQQDLRPMAVETFADLSNYCYRVAGVVGLASVHIWGFEGGGETEAMAIDRGTAFQLTNILRDLREDLGRGRLYLPREEMREHDLDERQLRGGGERFERFMKLQTDRAEMFYNKSAGLEGRIAADSRPTLRAMTEIYHRLLKKIAADPQRVLRQRVSLSLPCKLRIAWRAMRRR